MCSTRPHVCQASIAHTGFPVAQAAPRNCLREHCQGWLTLSLNRSLLVFCLSTSWCGFSYRKIQGFYVTRYHQPHLSGSRKLTCHSELFRPPQTSTGSTPAGLVLPLGDEFPGPTCRRAPAYKSKYQSRILIQGSCRMASKHGYNSSHL